MDDDLARMDREQLVEEVKRLRAGIRAHRDSSGHDLCWHHPELWGAVARAGRALDCGPALAAISAGVPQIPGIAGPPGAGRPALGGGIWQQAEALS